MTVNDNKQPQDTIDAAEWNEVATAANKVNDQQLVAADVSDFDAAVSSNIDVAANTTHRISDGTDHTYIDQDVTTTAFPSFMGALFTTIYNNGASGAIDWNNGAVQKLGLTANTTVTFTSPSNPSRLQLFISGGDSYSITWPSEIIWLTSGGTAPTLDGTDVITLFYDGINYYGTYSNQS